MEQTSVEYPSPLLLAESHCYNDCEWVSFLNQLLLFHCWLGRIYFFPFTMLLEFHWLFRWRFLFPFILPNKILIKISLQLTLTLHSYSYASSMKITGNIPYIISFICSIKFFKSILMMPLIKFPQVWASLVWRIYWW